MPIIKNRSYTYPIKIPPTNMKRMYRLRTRFFINVAIPAITRALVPCPVIMNASIAPPPAPPAINALMSGIEDSVLIYRSRPTKAARYKYFKKFSYFQDFCGYKSWFSFLKYFLMTLVLRK